MKRSFAVLLAMAMLPCAMGAMAQEHDCSGWQKLQAPAAGMGSDPYTITGGQWGLGSNFKTNDG